ncbi:TIM-barrel domain-containing protein [uncultured Streptomyces sp.]|uniref:TIM-barrel domain-containing protein n=1 Tax=uncultured Streptomyces sp. TaxID=174707 RepID=UPI002637D1F1|nr:TIM-barrel domain-containing protein [uncultured Streptomyces sp.]
MDGRDLVRSVMWVGPVRGARSMGAAWRSRRADARASAARGAERARVPGAVVGAEPGPGGGVVRFARSDLRIRVTAGGAVFWAWDGAEALPSYALPGAEPEPDARARLEPRPDGGWQVVSERLTLAVSRDGWVELRTPGGRMLRREAPPRWWEPVGGGRARWVQRSEVPADARFFGPAGPAGPASASAVPPAPRGGGVGRGGDGASGAVAMPVQMVVADAGTHLVLHDTAWPGRVMVREGEEGAGSGQDRRGTCEVRVDGGPLRCWAVTGTPARVLRGWAALTGAPAVPPSWALGPQHAGEFGSVQEVRRIVTGFREHGLELSAVHVAGRAAHGVPDTESRAGGTRWVRAAGAEDAVASARTVCSAGAVESGGFFEADGGGAVAAGVPGRAGAAGVAGHGGGDGPVGRAPTGPGEGRGAGAPAWAAGVWHVGGGRVSGAPAGADRTGPARAVRVGAAVRRGPGGGDGAGSEAEGVAELRWARAWFDEARRLRPADRPFVLAGSAWAGSQRYGGCWPAGETAGWEGLRASLASALGLGLCGVPYPGTDVGGPGATPELYVRWHQLASYLPLSRTGGAGAARRRAPWEFGPEVLDRVRASALERERLHPYLVTLAGLARLTGAPPVRPVWWDAAGDRALRAVGDAFLLGDALLVAPVLGPGVDRRAVRLPRGRWYDTATGTVYEGPGRVLVDAPADRIPVLARAGAVIPVRGEGGGTELEVWAPAPGRRGAGALVPDPGDGWDEPRVERYTSRWVDGRVTVEGAGPVRWPVRVRGAAESGARPAAPGAAGP